ncbi:MAG: hypothetical protein KAJ13_06150 [Gemmatimonadetes bacterium]|jgi:hypothetical protein|nr:hypothetical protein [Gemmatimonadota bacterium]
MATAMPDLFSIAGDGSFELDGKFYCIPNHFSPREVFSYRRLLEPIPDIPGGAHLSIEQRTRQKTYFFCRAAACIIPGLEPSALEGVTLGGLLGLHRWLLDHRPELTLDRPVHA